MGNLSHGFLDGFSGRLGNVVGYSWRGRMCIRSMPSHYNDARTPQQLSQRALFKSVVRLAARAKRVLKVGLRVTSLEAQMTESNYFMRINKQCFSVAASGAQASSLQSSSGCRLEACAPEPAYQGLVIDYENLVLASGPVAPVAFGSVRMIDEVTLSVDFEKNPLHRVVKSEDLVYIAAYCPELGDFDLSAPAYRRSNKVTISLNDYWCGREVHLWGFVIDGAGRASMSQYLGCVVLDEEWFSALETSDNEFVEDADAAVVPVPPHSDASPVESLSEVPLSDGFS